MRSGNSCKFASISNALKKARQLRMCTWNCQTIFVAAGYRHQRHVLTADIAASLAKSHDIVCIQETHGCEADLKELMSVRINDSEGFGSFCANADEGGCVILARRSLLQRFDRHQFTEIIKGRACVLTLSINDGTPVCIANVHMVPGWAPAANFKALNDGRTEVPAIIKRFEIRSGM